MSEQAVDVLLIGGGVMSATLGTLLAELDPSLRIVMAERLDAVALESTDGWNNAGTGHAGYCELNYTPQAKDGSVAIERALAINAAFEVSLQLWSSLVARGALPEPKSFINPTPHISFVWGAADRDFLRQRHEKLSAHHLFEDMVYSEDPAQLRAWMPLVMQQRDAAQTVAATYLDYGTDVDFGALTRGLVAALAKQSNFSLRLQHSVETLRQQKDGRWHVRLRDAQNHRDVELNAGFVFLGAGGGALPLLQKSGIPESYGYGGFPVSGQWLVCNNPNIVARHSAKVYGKAPLGAPPMSVPHLDTRIINGQQAMLFGPYAGFTTKFLKRGSFLDLIASVGRCNLTSMLAAGRDNMDLTRYLIGEVLQSHHARMDTLRRFFPEARDDEWTLATAGQRVQIIKHGKLEFGTEVVTAADGTLAALLGASPGASTSVQAMLGILERCFKTRMQSGDWQQRLRALVPSYGSSLVDDAKLLRTVRAQNLDILKLR